VSHSFRSLYATSATMFLLLSVPDYLLGDIAIDISEGYYYVISMSRPTESDSSGVYKARLDGTDKNPVILMSGVDSYVFAMTFNWAAG
jgi:hypothetical protein